MSLLNSVLKIKFYEKKIFIAGLMSDTYANMKSNFSNFITDQVSPEKSIPFSSLVKGIYTTSHGISFVLQLGQRITVIFI